MATWSKLVQVCRVAKIVLGSLRSEQDGTKKKKMNRTNQSCEESARHFSIGSHADINKQGSHPKHIM